jgi:hypothetical protein
MRSSLPPESRRKSRSGQSRSSRPAVSSAQGSASIFRRAAAPCACGGGCPRCRNERIHPKLEGKAAVSQAHDASERDADRIAEHATGAPAGAAPVPHSPLGALAASGDDLAPAGGGPLESGARADMEKRFGADFGAVRIHTGESAARLASGYDALAYTAGRNIVFGAGQYAPESAAGRKLLAHELAHVMQQAAVPAHGGAAPSARVLRSPVQVGGKPGSPLSTGTQSLHDDLMEEYRKANGLPPHGIDSATGQQAGPTDQELLYGGILDAWVAAKSGAIPAPAKAPKLVGAGTEDVQAGCRKDNQGDENDFHYCRRHREFVTNIYPQAVENIRNVPSPYSEAIARLYASVLPAVRLLAGATPKRGDPPLQTIGGYPGKLTFGATTHTFPGFTLLLFQDFSSLVAEEIDLNSGAIAIRMNEQSEDVMLRNFPAIESAMVHEAMHAFSKVVEGNNAAAAASGMLGAPARAAVDLNLDRSSYGALASELERAVLPYVTQIAQLPSLKGQPAVSAQLNASITVNRFFSETIARVEQAIYEKQRAGQGFAPGDLSAVPDFYTFDSYWEPQPPANDELVGFLGSNREQIRKDLGPILREVGARYLSLRPRTEAPKNAGSKP